MRVELEDREMPFAPGTFALIGMTGLVSLIAAGLVSAVGCHHLFEQPTGVSVLLSKSLFSLGAVLEGVMIVGIVAGV